MKKILFISSCGGHLEELLRIRSIFKSCDYKIVCEKTKTSEFQLKQYSNVSYLLYGTKDHLLPYILIFPINCILSLIIFLSFNPEYVVTTGTHTAVPMCYIAHFFKRKVLYIETFANVNTPTKAGKLVYKIADKFVVQWPSMKKIYKNAECWGSIF